MALGLGFRDLGLAFRAYVVVVLGLGFRDLGLGFRHLGLAFRAYVVVVLDGTIDFIHEHLGGFAGVIFVALPRRAVFWHRWTYHILPLLFAAVLLAVSIEHIL